jgi:hypothetical protein
MNGIVLMAAHDVNERVDRRRESLLKEYAEVASNFRLLTDIRFKLLAFLPLAAAAAAALRGGGGADGATAVMTLGLSLFGAFATIALASYNVRNDQLYDELVGRAAHIERAIGLPDGAFANRPTSWLSIRLPLGLVWAIDHRTSVGMIYGASIALWLFMGCYSIAQLAYAGDEPARWALGLAALVAITSTALGAFAFHRQREARRDVMRGAAERAVILAKKGLHEAAGSENFRRLCAGLSNKYVAASDAFRDLARRPIDELTEQPDPVETAALNGRLANDRIAHALEKVGKQAEYYAKLEGDPVLGRHYGLEGVEPAISKESAFVALVTDLPPRWIEDVSTKRR